MFIVFLAVCLCSCQAKKKIVENSPVLDVSDSIKELSMVSYYSIEKVDGEDTWVEHAIEGFPEFSMKDGKEFMTIALSGSEKKILCERKTHPVSQEAVFLQIGGDSSTRER